MLSQNILLLAHKLRTGNVKDSKIFSKNCLFSKILFFQKWKKPKIAFFFTLGIRLSFLKPDLGAWNALKTSINVQLPFRFSNSLSTWSASIAAGGESDCTWLSWAEWARCMQNTLHSAPPITDTMISQTCKKNFPTYWSFDVVIKDIAISAVDMGLDTTAS